MPNDITIKLKVGKDWEEEQKRLLQKQYDEIYAPYKKLLLDDLRFAIRAKKTGAEEKIIKNFISIFGLTQALNNDLISDYIYGLVELAEGKNNKEIKDIKNTLSKILINPLFEERRGAKEILVSCEAMLNDKRLFMAQAKQVYKKIKFFCNPNATDCQSKGYIYCDIRESCKLLIQYMQEDIRGSHGEPLTLKEIKAYLKHNNPARFTEQKLRKKYNKSNQRLYEILKAKEL